MHTGRMSFGIVGGWYPSADFGLEPGVRARAPGLGPPVVWPPGPGPGRGPWAPDPGMHVDPRDR